MTFFTEPTGYEKTILSDLQAPGNACGRTLSIMPAFQAGT
jgi:hypothetical protein